MKMLEARRGPFTRNGMFTTISKAWKQVTQGHDSVKDRWARTKMRGFTPYHSSGTGERTDGGTLLQCSQSASKKGWRSKNRTWRLYKSRLQHLRTTWKSITNAGPRNITHQLLSHTWSMIESAMLLARLFFVRGWGSEGDDCRAKGLWKEFRGRWQRQRE